MEKKIPVLYALLCFGGCAIFAVAMPALTRTRRAVDLKISADGSLFEGQRIKESATVASGSTSRSTNPEKGPAFHVIPTWRPVPDLSDRQAFCTEMTRLMGSRPTGSESELLTVMSRLQGLDPLMGRSDRIRRGDPFFESYSLLAMSLMSKDLPDTGLLLEFGVAEGVSANISSKIIEGSTHPGRTLYAFDSFLGLPEEYVGGHIGAFTRQGKQPTVRERVQIVQGWFNETLPGFLKDHTGSAAFVNIDCDVYGSTMTVLSSLRPRFQCGTLLHFHEMNRGSVGGNPGSDELLALHDFLRTDISVKLELLNLSPGFWEPVVFRVSSGC